MADGILVAIQTEGIKSTNGKVSLKVSDFIFMTSHLLSQGSQTSV